MNFSSGVWLLLIAVGAMLVAIGNINFNSARDRERTQAASEKALLMIRQECGNNLGQINEMRKAITNNLVLTDSFQTAAWNIVSSGGLLVQVNQDTLGKIAEIYYLIDLLNRNQARLLELTFGTSSALANAPQIQQAHIGFIKNILDRLEPKLLDITKH